MLSRGYRSRQINGNKFAIEPIGRTNSNGRTEPVNLFAQLESSRMDKRHGKCCVISDEFLQALFDFYND